MKRLVSVFTRVSVQFLSSLLFLPIFSILSADGIAGMLDDHLVGDCFTDLSAVWTRAGVRESVSRILTEKNTLFDSFMGKVYHNPEMSRTLERILFAGDFVSYNAYNIGMI